MRTKITTTICSWRSVLAIAAGVWMAWPATAAAADDGGTPQSVIDKIKTGLKTAKDVKQKYDKVKETADALASVGEFINELRLATDKDLSQEERSKHWRKAGGMLVDWAIDQAKQKAIDLILAANPELAAAVKVIKLVKNGADWIVTIAETGQRIGRAISSAVGTKPKTGLVNQLIKD